MLDLRLKIDELNRYASRGWVSGVSFYQFFRKGGLHDVIEGFHWLATNQSKIVGDSQLYLNITLFEQCCNELSSFIIKYIIEDEKTNIERDQRH